MTRDEYNKLFGEVQALENQVQTGIAQNNKRQENCNKKRFLCMQSTPGDGVFMPPGDITTVNDTIWPFVFGTGRVNVAALSTVPSQFSITQDGAFVIHSYTKSVFTADAFPLTTTAYLDPDAPNGAGESDGLSMQFRNAQSRIQLMQSVINLNQVGHPLYPTKFPRPMILNPMAIFEVNFANTSTNNYVVFVQFFGYRLRLDKLTSQ